MTELDDLYAKIPKSVPCKEGCTDCCGIVLWNPEEIRRVGRSQPLDKELRCLFAKDGRCTVYENRPFICRMFGNSKHPMLTCPYGCNNPNALSKEESDALTREYLKTKPGLSMC